MDSTTLAEKTERARACSTYSRSFRGNLQCLSRDVRSHLGSGNEGVEKGTESASVRNGASLGGAHRLGAKGIQRFRHGPATDFAVGPVDVLLDGARGARELFKIGEEICVL
jgi:hypothetical protein